MFTLIAQAFPWADQVQYVNACPYMRLKGWNTCQDLTKSSKWFLEMLSTGAFEIVNPGELDAELVADHKRLHMEWQAKAGKTVRVHPSIMTSEEQRAFRASRRAGRKDA